MFSRKDTERFMAKIKFFEKGKCWEWSGYRRKDGYANFWIGDKVFLAHRVSYMLTNGQVDQGLKVCHKCDNRACVNPSHLWVGTQKENMQDCKKKGRLKNPETEKTHCKHGHPLFGENLRVYVAKSGLSFRKCRKCDCIRSKKYRSKK